jgi:hypothetical protein
MMPQPITEQTMADLTCSECEKIVSIEAATCPHCGAPIRPVDTVAVSDVSRATKGSVPERATTSNPKVSDDERGSLLAEETQRELMNGAQAVPGSRDPYSAVFKRGKEPAHIFHLLITMFTCGLWAGVWLFFYVQFRGEKPYTVKIDVYGNCINSRQESPKYLETTVAVIGGSIFFMYLLFFGSCLSSCRS